MLHIGRYSSLFSEIIISLLMIFISPDTGRIMIHVFLSCHTVINVRCRNGHRLYVTSLNSLVCPSYSAQLGRWTQATMVTYSSLVHHQDKLIVITVKVQFLWHHRLYFNTQNAAKSLAAVALPQIPLQAYGAPSSEGGVGWGEDNTE